MIVDLVPMNDISRVCTPESVRTVPPGNVRAPLVPAPGLGARGQLARQVSARSVAGAFQAVRSPAPEDFGDGDHRRTGAYRDRAYRGSLGYLGFLDGTPDTSILIRTITAAEGCGSAGGWWYRGPIGSRTRT